MAEVRPVMQLSRCAVLVAFAVTVSTNAPHLHPSRTGAQGNMQKPSINIVLVRNPALDDENDGVIADAGGAIADTDTVANAGAAHDSGDSASIVSV